MSRFLRGYGIYRLGKPTVVAAAVTHRPVQVRLAPSHRLSRGTHTFLGRVLPKPGPDFGGGGKVAGSAQVTLAPSHRRSRAAHSFLGRVLPKPGPDFGGGGKVVGTAAVTLAGQQHQRAARTRSFLQPPAVVGAPAALPPAAPVSVHLARSRRGHGAMRWLRPPVVVSAAAAPAAPAQPLRVTLARTPARLAHSKLRPPTVVAGASTFQAAKAPFARTRRGRGAMHFLRPPVIMGAVAAASAPFAAVRVTLAPRNRRPLVGYRLQGPLVVVAATTFPGPEVRLATSRRPKPPIARVQPPAVINPAPPPTPPFRPVQVNLTRALPPRRNTYRLRGPVVVGQATVFGPVRTRLARRPRQAGASLYRLQPPTIMGTVTPVVPPTPDVGGPGGPTAVGPRVKGLTYDEWRRLQDQDEIAVAIALLWGRK